MKDSGIEWVGEIPTHWDIQTLKYQTEKYERGTAPDYTDEIMTKVVNQATFSKGYFDTRNIRYSSKDAKTSRGLLKKGDVLLASTGGGVLGKTHFFNEDDVYVADSHVTIVRTIDTLLSKYLYYYFSVNYSTFNAVMAEGSTNQTELQRDLLGKMPVPFPPIEEQQKIASFLDEKCTNIDSLISKLKKQTETLADYKKSLITETVTKGLNSDVEMRDSGIAWVGDIPKHWITDKVKFHLIRREPRNPGNKQVLSVYREYGVIPKDSRDDNHNVTSEDTSNYKYVVPDNLVINKMKAWQGSMGISDYEGIVSPAYFIYTFTNDLIVPKYLHYLFRSCYKDEFRRISGGIREGQWDLSSMEFANTFLLIPPKNEQISIIEYLKSKTSEIDSIISEKKQQIKTLEEYKKSLIFEYVTGKKEIQI